ncbi:hypothetical protein DJ83_02520 [Halorubrum ezzemoulense]|uniref:Uncharacterized protein n=1 Tax=Halorubrum ezzemoulense TaxID=337243 RepID=A0A256J4G4_HALEZ|nr:hypothetical protein [Halorubrum ezzemoulense]OYR63436.1 hypothetical protein DJ83_02520 [Halorubrum ezzemoulense]
MTGARSTQSGSNREDSEDGSNVVRGCPAPGEVLGRLPADAGLRRQLAAAARSRGRTASVAGEIADIEAELAGIEVEPVDLTAARRRVAEATGEIERLKERVAALRGDVRARRELAEAMYPEFRRALAVVPSGDPSAAGTGPGAYDGDPVAASLAAVRTAALDGPVELRGSAARRIEESGRSPRSLLRTADVRFRGARDGR